MTSKIEQIIDEIEEYINGCKYATFSSTKILVNKEEMDDFLHELKKQIPDEVKRYQKIVSNKDAIMVDARQKADDLIKQAQMYTDQMVNEHTIMQQAYQQAGEVVNQARIQAQQIIESATMQANEIQYSAMQYTDDSLAAIQELLSQSIEQTQIHDANLIDSLSQILTVVNQNRMELHPEEELSQNEAIVNRAEAVRNRMQEQAAADSAAQPDMDSMIPYGDPEGFGDYEDDGMGDI